MPLPYGMPFLFSVQCSSVDIRQIIGTEGYHPLLRVHLADIAPAEPVKIQIIRILKYHTGNGEGIFHRLLQESIQGRGGFVPVTVCCFAAPLLGHKVPGFA